MTKKSLGLVAITVGGLLILTSLLLPWWPNDPVSPIGYLFTSPSYGNRIIIIYALPDLIAGLTAVFLEFFPN